MFIFSEAEAIGQVSKQEMYELYEGTVKSNMRKCEHVYNIRKKLFSYANIFQCIVIFCIAQLDNI